MQLPFKYTKALRAVLYLKTIYCKGRDCFRPSRAYFGDYTEQECMNWEELYKLMETPLYYFRDESWETVGTKCRLYDIFMCYIYIYFTF